MTLFKYLNAERIVGFPLIAFLIMYPLFSSDFSIGLMGKFVALIIFAISLDLIWGYTGLLSIGHAVFFGLGGYLIALSYSFQNGVPSFMIRFDIQEIPFFMVPLKSIPIAFILGLLIPALLAFLIGNFIFKSKVSGVYFSIITLVLASLFELLIINLQAYTGGYNGLMGLPRFPLFGEPLSLLTFYYVVLTVAVLIYLLSKYLVSSHFGKVIKGVRENEERVDFLNYRSSNFKIFIYVISGFIAGLAGMLYVSMNGFVSSGNIGVSLSISVVLWVAIGGRGYLMGAVVGTLLINWLSNTLSEQFPSIWQLFTGIIMLLVVIFLTDGVYGTFKKWFDSFKEHSMTKKSTKFNHEKQ